jgi:hypothetical protein
VIFGNFERSEGDRLHPWSPPVTCVGAAQTREGTPGYGETFSPIPVDTGLGDYEEISLERARLRIVHTPGHTPGSVQNPAWVSILFRGGFLSQGRERYVGNPLYGQSQRPVNERTFKQQII